MPKKIIGLGFINDAPSNKDGVSVSIFSGSTGVTADSTKLVQVSEFSIDSNETIKSLKSITSFHSTLFEDFNLRAESVYNFYTSDEQVNFNLPNSSSLNLLPRYISLKWNTVPKSQIKIGKKDIKQPAEKNIAPALPLNEAKNSISNGYISPGVVSVLLVNPIGDQIKSSSFHEDVFLASNSSAGKSAASSLDNTNFHAVNVNKENKTIRVNFVDSSIAGALSNDRIEAAKDHAHLATLASFAKLVPSLEVLSEFNQDVNQKNQIPKFIVKNEAKTLAYIGYVIERYTLLEDGSMLLSRTIDIDDIETSSFVDREVLYGARYCYRIKTIVQWTYKKDESFFGKSKLDRVNLFNPASSTNKQASFYSGDWSDWCKAQIVDNVLPEPPEEIYIRPISNKKQIEIVWKMPADQQKDLSNIVLVKSVVSSGKMQDWTIIGKFDASNGRYADSDVGYIENTHCEYVYALYSISRHDEISKLSDQYKVSITSKYKYSNENKIKRVAAKGRDFTTHASSIYTDDNIELIATKNCSFYCRTGKSSNLLFKRKYIVEIQSLSTGEKSEVVLVLDANNVLPSSVINRQLKTKA